jgi:hypothetical protein
MSTHEHRVAAERGYAKRERAMVRGTWTKDDEKGYNARKMKMEKGYILLKEMEAMAAELGELTLETPEEQKTAEEEAKEEAKGYNAKKMKTEKKTTEKTKKKKKKMKPKTTKTAEKTAEKTEKMKKMLAAVVALEEKKTTEKKKKPKPKPKTTDRKSVV